MTLTMAKTESRAKGPLPVPAVVLGEQVNARELIRRLDEMEVLSKRITPAVFVALRYDRHGQKFWRSVNGSSSAFSTGWT